MMYRPPRPDQSLLEIMRSFAIDLGKFFFLLIAFVWLAFAIWVFAPMITGGARALTDDTRLLPVSRSIVGPISPAFER